MATSPRPRVYKSTLPHLRWRAHCNCLWMGRDYATHGAAIHGLRQHLRVMAEMDGTVR